MRFFVFLAEGRGRVGGLPEERRGTGGVLAHVPSGADYRPAPWLLSSQPKPRPRIFRISFT